MSLQEMRKKAGLSQSQLAEKSGIKLRTIQCYEINNRDIDGASLETLLKLAYALNCKVIDILNSNELKKLLAKSKVK